MTPLSTNTQTQPVFVLVFKVKLDLSMVTSLNYIIMAIMLPFRLLGENWENWWRKLGREGKLENIISKYMGQGIQ